MLPSSSPSFVWCCIHRLPCGIPVFLSLFIIIIVNIIMTTTTKRRRKSKQHRPRQEGGTTTKMDGTAAPPKAAPSRKGRVEKAALPRRNRWNHHKNFPDKTSRYFTFVTLWRRRQDKEAPAKRRTWRKQHHPHLFLETERASKKEHLPGKRGCPPDLGHSGSIWPVFFYGCYPKATMTFSKSNLVFNYNQIGFSDDDFQLAGRKAAQE